jgi:hypothetical protein
MQGLKWIHLFFISSLLVSLHSFASSDKPVKGRFVITQQGEEQLIDGSHESITWFFNLDGNGNALLKISSWHAQFTCDGVYQVVQENKQLQFIWKKDSNPHSACNTPPPQFIMKQDGKNKWQIKSELFLWGDGGWEDLKISKNK